MIHEKLIETITTTTIFYLKGVFSKYSGNHIVAPIFCIWSEEPQNFIIDPVLIKDFEIELKLDLHSG